MNEMKLGTRCGVIAWSLAWSLCAGTLEAADPPPQVPAETLELDRSSVHRIQPSLEGLEMVLVPPEEIKPGLAYNYYNPRLGRRVWGFARDDRSFQYAFGEGTTLPIDRFDLRISTATRREILERAAPGLERDIEITGRFPAVRLDPAGQWRLLRQTSTARVFDVQTGHRWEWHGGRRLAVLHTHGNRWALIDGRYLPATAPWFAAAPCGCGLARAGSAMLVVRTGEPSR